MKRLNLFLAVMLAAVGCTPDSGRLTLLVGTYTDTDSKGIYTFSFDPQTGESKPLAVTEVSNPSFLALSPDGGTVYAVSEEQVGAAVSAYSFDPAAGTLELRSRQSALGRSSCHVTCTGRNVVATNYSSGGMTVFPLDEKGDLLEGTKVQFFECGPDTVRQSSSHIHSSQVSPDGKWLFVIDLGGDCIFRYPVEDGKVCLGDSAKIKVPAGEGPRHFTYSNDGRFMYVLTELGGNVVVFEYAGGDLKQIQVAEADPLHAGGSADVHFSPDGRFLYASNRLEGDGISIFSQDPQSGLLTFVANQPTGVHPRNFAITPDGGYLLAACRDSDEVQVFRRDAASGLLEDTGKRICVPHPVCVLAVRAARAARAARAVRAGK